MIYFTCENEKIDNTSDNTRTPAPQVASGCLRSERKDLIRLYRFGMTTVSTRARFDNKHDKSQYKGLK